VTTNRDEHGEEHRLLREAHQLLKEQADLYGVTKIQTLYFKDPDSKEFTLSIGTLKSVIRENLHGKSLDTQTAMLRFRETVLAQRDQAAQKRIYYILSNILKVGDQSRAANYVGEYVCYRIRAGTEKSNRPTLLVGTIKIEHRSGEYWFEHVSDDSSPEAAKVQIVHTGPFYVLENRVYLVGWGTDIYGAHMRPIIFQTHETPKKAALRGILLTETAEGSVPAAARTVLFHNELHVLMKTKNTKEELEKRILDDYLRADARNPSLKRGNPVNATNLLGW